MASIFGSRTSKEAEEQVLESTITAQENIINRTKYSAFTITHRIYPLKNKIYLLAFVVSQSLLATWRPFWGAEPGKKGKAYVLELR
jgi:hypothetical protein